MDEILRLTWNQKPYNDDSYINVIDSQSVWFKGVHRRDQRKIGEKENKKNMDMVEKRVFS